MSRPDLEAPIQSGASEFDARGLTPLSPAYVPPVNPAIPRARPLARSKARAHARRSPMNMQ